MRSFNITRFLILLILCSHILWSQKYPSTHFSTLDKLPNNTIRALLVDSSGFLWIGTDNGLVKKENNVFTSFFEENGLAMNNTWAIAEDINNNIWAGSYGAGLSIYDGTNFRNLNKDDGLINNEITKLHQHNNLMYVGSSDGVSVIDVDNLKIISAKPNIKQPYRVTSFFEYKGEVYCTSYNTGAHQVVVKGDSLQLIPLADKSINYFSFIDGDTIYNSRKEYFTKTPLVKYLKDSTLQHGLGASMIWDYVKTGDDRIFAAAWGIYSNDGGVYEIVNNELSCMKSEFDIPSREVISLAYNDELQRLYVGTRDSGLYEVDVTGNILFTPVSGKTIIDFAQLNDIDATLYNASLSLKSKHQQIEVSTSQFKNWEEKYLHKKHLPLPKKDDNFYELDYKTPVEDIKFYDIKTDESSFWINSNVGLYVLDTIGKLKQYLPIHSEEINFTSTGNLIETNPYGGVRIFDDIASFKYKYYADTLATTPTMVVNSLKKGEKTYFLSVFSGLYTWEEDGFKSYLKDSIWDEEKLRHITPLGSHLAISNEFGDIFIVDDSADFKVVNKISRSHINGNTINFLNQYRGYLIIGTDKGLTLYKDGKYIITDKEHGLKTPLKAAVVDGKYLYVGSEGGRYDINLDFLINCKDRLQSINLTSISINGEEIAPEDIFKNGKAILDHDDNTLLIKYNTNQHRYPNKMLYQYRINPQRDWSTVSSQPEIYLAYLPPANYELEVKILDQSTGIYFQDKLISIQINPPFWKRWWFIILAILLIASIIYLIYRRELHKNREFEAEKRTILKRVEETKMEALLAQMNPHFIFNAMNSIQNYIIDSDIDNASIFLSDFSKLIRINLDHCTRAHILLIEEIEYLKAFVRVENTRFNEKVNIDFRIDPTIDIYDVEIPSMIIQPFVENVFVHAFPPCVAQPQLTITFSMAEACKLQCTIADNGVGISTNTNGSLHKSKGIKLVKERLKLLDYDVEKALSITSNKEGTAVTITFSLER